MLWDLPQQEFLCLKGPTKLACSFGEDRLSCNVCAMFNAFCIAFFFFFLKVF